MAKKMGSGNGSLFFDNSRKKWVVQRYVIEDQTGQAKNKRKIFSTQEEAQEYLKSIMYQKENPIFIKNNGIPLLELMKINLQKKLEMNIIKESTEIRTMQTIDKISKSYIANKKIEEITADEIQDYLNSLKNYSNSYIKKIYEQIAQALKYATSKGYIAKNPLVDVRKPKSTKPDKEVKALEIDEQQLITEYLLNVPIEKQPYKNAYLIQMYMGLRIGEVLALKNTDVDLQHNLLQINKTLTIAKKERIILGDTTKNYAGTRELPIPEFMKNIIIEQMETGKNNKNNMLFLNSRGKIVDPRNANETLKNILKTNFNITGVTTHTLRHTYGTRCIEGGMRAVALQRLMGHKDISVTLNTYTSVFNKYKQSEIEKVNQYYINKSLMKNNNINLLEESKTKNIER